ncbi:MAG: hypothetical protein EAZ55_01360 [Cytophagales bacterium]|nr:MAG: hypothetical protein EAZ55_01360 [Cytophagales bacterium]
MDNLQQIKQLQQQINLLKSYILAGTIIFAMLLLSSYRTKKDINDNIIRTQGIIIQDSLGRDRILIGNPIPYSKDRVRTNMEKVAKTWAKDLGGDKYMEWYKGYRHSANGIVFLNEEGYDKILVGDQLPDPNTGKRIVDAAGLMFNDDKGYERGGLGVSRTTEGSYRLVLGMDDEQGEALHMFILEDGTRGIRIAGTEGQMLMGSADANNSFFNNKEKFMGISVFNNDGKILWQKNALIDTNK